MIAYLEKVETYSCTSKRVGIVMSTMMTNIGHLSLRSVAMSISSKSVAVFSASFASLFIAKVITIENTRYTPIVTTRKIK